LAATEGSHNNHVLFYRCGKIVRMFAVHSLRSRLLVLWALSLAASVAVGVLLVQFYRQSTAAQVQRAEAVVARACDMIRERYDSYVVGRGEPELGHPDRSSEASLNTVVSVALARELGVEGGIWQIGRGSRAYAFPTYEGSGPKTDVPSAELDRIRSVNQEAARAEQPVLSRSVSRTQTLLVFACPLSGGDPRLTAWTMTRVEAAPGYARLQLGVGVLFGLMVGMSAWLTLLMRSWSRSIGGIESALAQHSAETLPRLAPTGERELDRIVGALNEAGERLIEARRRSDELAARVAATERLAALGRVAAGVAHEIRNPIAAMRLKVENAVAGDDERRRAILNSLVVQIDRLDRLVSELLAMTQRRAVAVRDVDVLGLLRSCAADYHEAADARGVRITVNAEIAHARLDPDLIRRALGNLLLNAIQHTEEGGRVTLAALRVGDSLRLQVSDTGCGVTAEVRHNLFEPFVTGRADGTGLGLAIVRELVEAHGGKVLLLSPGGGKAQEGAVFALDLPWPQS
jgi:signal transduction histidine kinase